MNTWPMLRTPQNIIIICLVGIIGGLIGYFNSVYHIVHPIIAYTICIVFGATVGWLSVKYLPAKYNLYE